MAIGSLPMNLSEIITEFSGPTNMAAYVRGGTYVPNTSDNTAIATAVPLTMSTFVDAVNRLFSLSSYAAGIYANNPFGAATATFTLGTDGAGWTTPVKGGIGASYDARLTKNSGDTMTGSALATWLVLSTARTWSITALVGNSALANVTLETRPTGGGATLASVTFDMGANGF